MTNFVTPKGVAIWPKLNKPDTKFNADGEYTVKLRIPAEEATDLIETLEGIRDAYKEMAVKKDPKVKQYKMADLYEEEVDDQGDLTGAYLFKFKQKATITNRQGQTVNMKVALFDSQKKPTDALIYGGSIIRVAASAIGYAMPSTKMVGLSLRPSAVQIIELVTAGASGAQAFDVEDGFVAEEKQEQPVNNVEDAFEDDDADF